MMLREGLLCLLCQNRGSLQERVGSEVRLVGGQTGGVRKDYGDETGGGIPAQEAR